MSTTFQNPLALVFAEGEEDGGTKVVEVQQPFATGPYPVRMVVPADASSRGPYVVYEFIDPRSMVAFYIGSTGRFLTRMRTHCTVLAADDGYPREREGQWMIHTRKLEIAKAGYPVISRIVSEHETREAAVAEEMRLINERRNTLLNVQEKYTFKPWRSA